MMKCMKLHIYLICFPENFLYAGISALLLSICHLFPEYWLLSTIALVPFFWRLKTTNILNSIIIGITFGFCYALVAYSCIVHTNEIFPSQVYKRYPLFFKMIKKNIIRFLFPNRRAPPLAFVLIQNFKPAHLKIFMCK